jgi:hypothetical protein
MRIGRIFRLTVWRAAARGRRKHKLKELMEQAKPLPPGETPVATKPVPIVADELQLKNTIVE